MAGHQGHDPSKNMTLAAAVAPLAAYAVFFQTAVYLSLPGPLRRRWAPTFTGWVGFAVVVASASLFGLQRIGLGPFDLPAIGMWSLGAALVTGVGGLVMLATPSIRGGLADPRLAALSSSQTAFHVLVKIPFFTALVEEAVFRGVMHAALIALYPAPVALWLGAGLFGLWHIGPGLDQADASQVEGSGRVTHTIATVVVTTLAGAFLVWLRMETGSIWAPVAVHATVNMTMAVFARRAARVSS